MVEKQFLLSVMSSGNQSFNVTCRFELNGVTKTVNGKLDTGCSRSLLSANLLYETNEDKLREAHIQDIKFHLENKIHFHKSFGVESSPKNYKEPKTIEDALSNCNIRFKKQVNNLVINNYAVGDVPLFISYTIKDKFLIGMDIIKGMYSFIGPYNNQVYFLATRKEIVSISNLFKKAVYKLGNLTPDEDEYIDFLDAQALEANYMNTKIKNINIE